MAAAPKRRWLLLSAVAGVVALIVWLTIRQREPRVEGLPTSLYVLQTLASNRYGSDAVYRRLQAVNASVAVPALAKVIEREGSYWRRCYTNVYTRAPISLRKRMPTWTIDRQILSTAVFALGQYGPEAKSAVPIVAALYERTREGGDDFLASIVAKQLGWIGTNAQAAIPSLLKGTRRSQQRGIRTSAIAALALIDPTGERSSSTLGTLIFDADSAVVVAAVHTLGAMARRSPELVPHLRAAIQARELPVCLAAGGHMKELRALTREDLEPFLRDLQSSNAAIRLKGASVLIYACDFAPEAVPLLLPAADDADSKVREAALKSLVELAWDSGVVRTCRLAAAETVLRHGDANQSWLMMDVLPHIGATSPEALQLLVAALRNPSERTRGKAAQTLGCLGPIAKRASSALTTLLDDEWSNVREAATNALRAIRHRTRIEDGGLAPEPTLLK